MRFSSVLFMVVFSLSLTACGGEASDPASEELVKKAANGDQAAMRDLEKMVREKAKAEKLAMEKLNGHEKQAKQFYWDLAAGKIDDKRLNNLANSEQNIHAQVYMARTMSRRKNLTETDRDKLTTWLEEVSKADRAHLYYALNGGVYPLAGEAAFVISEDYLNAQWLYPSDMSKAVEWLKIAANAGQPEAMFKLATRLQYGLGMDKDMNAAKTWMQKSADAGSRSAKEALKNWVE